MREDFNFDGSGTARRSGWKFIYRGLYKPRGKLSMSTVLIKLAADSMIQQYLFGGKFCARERGEEPDPAQRSSK